MWTSPRSHAAAAALVTAALLSHAAGADAWSVLKEPGTIALIRHAEAPGVGDPKGWRLDDCPTQRNLSERGRRQAKALGDTFRVNGVQAEKVIASQWCRAADTAALMQIGAVEKDAAFNNAYVLYERRGELTHAARKLLSGWNERGLLVVVTHGDNIELLTGIVPEQGEIVAVRRAADDPERLTVTGRIRAIQPGSGG